MFKKHLPYGIRYWFIFSIFLIIFITLSIRLYYVMIVENDFARQRVMQQIYHPIVYFEGFEFKGDIYDRDMKRLTNDGTKNLAIILPSIAKKYIDNKDRRFVYLLNILCEYNKTDYKSVSAKIEKQSLNSSRAVVMEVNDRIKDEIDSISLPCIYVKSDNKKFGDNVGTTLLSSFLNNTINENDIKYDDSTDMKIFNYISRYVKKICNIPLDAKGGIIPDLLPVDEEREVNPGESAKDVVLTLDYSIQKVAEDTLYELCDKNCAATVMNIKTGEVLAMASKDENGWERNMVTYSGDGSAYNPGSLFKVVVLCAALENNKAGLCTDFVCTGKDNATGIGCYKKEGHGKLNLEDAFAVSCNTYFIELARRVGADSIISMAERLGFNKKVLNFSKESTGMLYRDKGNIRYDIGNIAIGQKDVMITPLQACSMMAAIADNGVMQKPYILKQVLNKDGTSYESYDSEAKRVISINTAETVRQLLENAVTNGTGKEAYLECGASGKTGTSQRGIKDLTGKYEYEDNWFAGYFPSKDPQFSISVYIEDADTKKVSAANLFKAIANKIINNASSNDIK